MVTGGEDKKVNVWAIGRPNAILSLSGHTSSVECVTFDSNESTVIAGSAGGTLKLWDLEQAKVARTLTGHRSNCISVQVYSDSEQCLLLAVVQRAFHVSQDRLMTADRVRVCIPRSGIPTANSLPRAQSTPISRFGIFGASRAFRRTRATPEVCGRSPSLPMGAGSSRAATMVWSSCGISRRAGERDAMPTRMSAPVLLSTISPASRICVGSCMNSPRTLRPYRALRCTRRNSSWRAPRSIARSGCGTSRASSKCAACRQIAAKSAV